MGNVGAMVLEQVVASAARPDRRKGEAWVVCRTDFRICEEDLCQQAEKARLSLSIRDADQIPDAYEQQHDRKRAKHHSSSNAIA